MSALLPALALKAIEAPLRVPEGRDRVGDALWLYLFLASVASYRGTVCTRPEKATQVLAVDDAQLGNWLAALEKSGLVRVISPAPFLVIRLLAYSDRESVTAATPSDSRAQVSGAHVDVPVGSSSAAAASIEHGEVGGQGEGEGLLREVLATLEEANPDEFRQLITRFPAATVRRALRRVQTTPASQIRKSKAALFRYLLGKLS